MFCKLAHAKINSSIVQVICSAPNFRRLKFWTNKIYSRFS